MIEGAKRDVAIASMGGTRHSHMLHPAERGLLRFLKDSDMKKYVGDVEVSALCACLARRVLFCQVYAVLLNVCCSPHHALSD